ncbi:MAG: DUF5606 domain-containing protein [Bacteroidales bacterium]
MVLKDILAISGEPGLFKFIAQGKNSMIVEHLETKKRSSAFGSAKVSSLEEISVYTDKEDMPLGKIFDLIYEKHSGGPAIDYKSDPEKLKVWFAEVVPEYDKDKVYPSDIKKIAHWYNILQGLNLLVKDEPEKEAKPESVEENVKKPAGKKKEEAVTKEKPAVPKKASRPKTK